MTATSSFQRIATRVALLGCGWAALACTSSQQKPVVATALNTKDTRETAFESTLRVLDEHPDYVDEFFAQAREHPKTLNRFLEVAAQHVHEDDLAERAAARLVRVPVGLKATLMASIVAMQDKPEAMKAAAAAIEKRPTQTAHMLVQREQAIKETVHALTLELQKNPGAASAFRQALSDNSDALASIITQDPELVATMFKSVAKKGVKRGGNELQAFLKAYAE